MALITPDMTGTPRPNPYSPFIFFTATSATNTIDKSDGGEQEMWKEGEGEETRNASKKHLIFIIMMMMMYLLKMVSRARTMVLTNTHTHTHTGRQ